MGICLVCLRTVSLWPSLVLHTYLAQYVEYAIIWSRSNLVLFLQVVGLVTRKDLARYRLGKGGLEELSLAQT